MSSNDKKEEILIDSPDMLPERENNPDDMIPIEEEHTEGSPDEFSYQSEEVRSEDELLEEQTPEQDSDDNEKERDTTPAEIVKQNLELVTEWSFDPSASPSDVPISLPPLITPNEVEPIEEADEQDILWDNARVVGYELGSADSRYVKSLTKGDWKQYADFGEVKGNIKQGALSDLSGKNIPEDDISLRILSHVGSGGVVQIPLVDSGFYVTITPPEESRIVELFDLIGKDKFTVGRDTYGAVFSNLSVIQERRFFNFIKENITKHTINFAKGEDSDIAKHILFTDWNILMWGMTVALNPEGHYYERACDHSPGSCRAVVKGTMSLARMAVVDDSVFTDKQRDHMSHVGDFSMPLDSIKKYQAVSIERSKRKYTIEHNLGRKTTFNLEICHMDEWFKQGETWISRMHGLAVDALGKSSTDGQRDKYMTQVSGAIEMRKYSHLVESIDTGETGMVKSVKHVSKALEGLSSNAEIRLEFHKIVGAFIDDTATSIIGVENYDCKECGKGQTVNGDPNTLGHYIIPVNVSTTFFTILGMRVLSH